MRKGGAWQRGSLAWWMVSCVAFLAICLFVAFDLLDLDGSALGDRLLGETAALTPSAADADAVPGKDPSHLEPNGVASLPPSLRLVTDASNTLARLTPTPITARLARIRPRIQVCRTTSSVHTASEASS